MREYEVVVQATVQQRVTVEADCWVDAIQMAEEDFDLLADDVSYKQEAVDCKEVGCGDDDPE